MSQSTSRVDAFCDKMWNLSDLNSCVSLTDRKYYQLLSTYSPHHNWIELISVHSLGMNIVITLSQSGNGGCYRKDFEKLSDFTLRLDEEWALESISRFFFSFSSVLPNIIYLVHIRSRLETFWLRFHNRNLPSRECKLNSHVH